MRFNVIIFNLQNSFPFVDRWKYIPNLTCIYIHRFLFKKQRQNFKQNKSFDKFATIGEIRQRSFIKLYIF